MTSMHRLTPVSEWAPSPLARFLDFGFLERGCEFDNT